MCSSVSVLRSSFCFEYGKDNGESVFAAMAMGFVAGHPGVAALQGCCRLPQLGIGRRVFSPRRLTQSISEITCLWHWSADPVNWYKRGDGIIPLSSPTRIAAEGSEQLQWEVNSATMREIVHIQAGQCGNQIGAKVNYLLQNVRDYILIIAMYVQ